MEHENASGGKAAGKAHYCVLYTQTPKQWKVNEAIRKVFPKGEGEAFYPCRELWWNGCGKTVYRPLFPGYVFVRTEMDRIGLHDLVLQTRRWIVSFVKEIGISASEDARYDESGIIRLSDEEAEFFDFLLGFRFDADLDRRREEAAAEGKFYKPADDLTDEEKAAAARLRVRRKRLPQKGVAQMSFGYMEGGRLVVMDGPLKGYESRIRDYIAKDRKACLDIGIGGQAAKVGLTVLGKKVWYPRDRESPDILPDGTALDTQELARIMMGGKQQQREKMF